MRWPNGSHATVGGCVSWHDRQTAKNKARAEQTPADRVFGGKADGQYTSRSCCSWMPHDFGVKPLYRMRGAGGLCEVRRLQRNPAQQALAARRSDRAWFGEWNETTAPPGKPRPRQCQPDAASINPQSLDQAEIARMTSSTARLAPANTRGTSKETCRPETRKEFER